MSEVCPHVLVLPVEIRLLGRETVEIPLAVTGRSPCRPTEERLPIVRRLFVASAVPEDVALTFGGAAARGKAAETTCADWTCDWARCR